MASYLPPYLTRVQQSTNAPSSSESISYDYSGADEILKRKKEAGDLSATYSDQLMNDPLASVSTGQRIRNLLSSLKDIEPVRVSSVSSSQDMGGGSTEIMGEHDEPKEEKPEGGGFVPPQPQRPKRGKTPDDAIPI